MHFALCNALNDSDPDRLYLFSLESSRRVALPPRCLCSSQRRRSSRFSSLFLRLFLLSAGHEKNGIRWLEEGRSRRRRRRQQRRRRCFYSSAGWDPPLSLACCQCRWQPLSPSPGPAALVAVRHWLTDGLGGASARCAACGRRRAVCGMQRAVCVGWEGVFGVCGMCAYLWVTIFLILCNIACGTRCTLHAARAEHTWLHGATWQTKSVNKCAKCHFYGANIAYA